MTFSRGTALVAALWVTIIAAVLLYHESNTAKAVPVAPASAIAVAPADIKRDDYAASVAADASIGSDELPIDNLDEEAAALDRAAAQQLALLDKEEGYY